MKPSGCKCFFDDDLKITEEDFEKIKSAAELFEQSVGSKIRGSKNSSQNERVNLLLDFLNQVIAVFDFAIKSPE